MSWLGSAIVGFIIGLIAFVAKFWPAILVAIVGGVFIYQQTQSASSAVSYVGGIIVSMLVAGRTE